MRILIVIGYLYPVIGGTEIAGYNVAKQLALRGHNVTVVTRYSLGFRPDVIRHTEDKMEEYEELCEGRLKIHRIRVLPMMVGRFLSHTLSTFRIAWRDPPDVIIGFTLMPHAFSAMLVKYLLLLTRFKRVPVIVWGRGSDVFVTPERKDIVGMITRFFLKAVFRADLILAQTPAMKKTLTSNYGCDPEKIEILGNGVDLNRFSPSKLTDKNVIFVGGARPAKGLPYLIKAVNQLPNTSLLVIGGWGEESELCKAMAKENVEFIGAVHPSKVPDYLNKASIFCLPSLSEGFPNAILEAMASGLPIVATKVGGVPYIVGDAGILVPPRDVEALKKALAFFSKKSKRKEYQKRSLQRVKLFTWERVIDKLQSFIDALK